MARRSDTQKTTGAHGRQWWKSGSRPVARALPVLMVSMSIGSMVAMGPADAQAVHAATVAAGVSSTAGHAVGTAAARTGGGWEAYSSGQVVPFGGAVSHGSLAGIHLSQPIVGIAATPSGNGYWLVASDGGIFSFGDA
ncbi:MAG TPA: hypothetical protein VG435_12510, partial [Acidimicrobiales bacterium]|nr:hypothetical protein [Acidimicrobiales bacterium]